MQPETVKLLFVDDVEENLTALEALLKDDGLELFKARSGPEALELLLIHDFALALLDVQMPGMDGFELAELMRGTERTRRVPIIFLTAVATDERRRFRGYEAGAVDYLLKPVDPQIVRNKVEIFVELSRQREEIARQRDALASALSRIHAHGDNSPLAIVEFDSDLRVLGWSQGAERLFGRAAEQVAGQRVTALGWVHEEDTPALEALVADMVAGKRPRHMQRHRIHHRDGGLLECEWYCSALLDASGTLVSINVQILDITERRRAEDTQRLLIGELNHRVKNTLASVQAIATQTLRHSPAPTEFAPTFIGRIHALARAHSLLSDTTWKGARLRELVDGQLQLGTIAADRLTVKGPDIDLAPETALHLALVLHELATNANKYGALSIPGGHVRFTWSLDSEILALDWSESGGPPVSPPSRRGFGTALIERSIKAEGGTAHATYGREGLHWRFTMPHTRLAPDATQASGSANGQAVTKHFSGAIGSGAIAGKRILIIEDEPLVALELVAILQEAGAEVVGPAATARQALDTIAQADFDGALLDGNLKGEMVDEIAAALTDRGIPFLFVSGYGRDHLPEAFEAVPVIGKPFDRGLLVRAISALHVREVVVIGSGG